MHFPAEMLQPMLCLHESCCRKLRVKAEWQARKILPLRSELGSVSCVGRRGTWASPALPRGQRPSPVF